MHNKQRRKTAGCRHKSCSSTSWMSIKVTKSRDCCGNTLQNTQGSVTLPETVSLLSFLFETKPQDVFALDGESNEPHIDFPQPISPKMYLARFRHKLFVLMGTLGQKADPFPSSPKSTPVYGHWSTAKTLDYSKHEQAGKRNRKSEHWQRNSKMRRGTRPFTFKKKKKISYQKLKQTH